MDAGDNKYYVYCYLDPRSSGKFTYGDMEFDNEPFYVGKGSKKRIGDHITPGYLKRDTNKKKVNKILSILGKGLKPIQIKLFENLTEEKSLEKEKEVVSTIGRMDCKKGPLTNLTDGGEHCVHWNDLSIEKQEELRIKRSINMKENNLMFDKEIAKRNGYARRGQIRSEEWKKEMSDKVKNSINYRKKVKHLEICQYDDKLNLLNIFISLRETSRQTGFSFFKIKKSINEMKCVDGYYFKINSPKI